MSGRKTNKSIHSSKFYELVCVRAVASAQIQKSFEKKKCLQQNIYLPLKQHFFVRTTCMQSKNRIKNAAKTPPTMPSK